MACLNAGTTIRPASVRTTSSGTASYNDANADNGPTIASLVFQVPATTQTGTPTFTPVGTLYPGDGLSPIPVGTTGLIPGNNKLAIKLSAQPGS
jgi:hypothetical protein